MPFEGKNAQKELCNIFTHAKKNIKIAMYTFTNKKIAKALKIAAKHGAKIYIIGDLEESKYKYSVIPNLAAIKKFNIYLLSGKNYKNGNKAKMHVKMSIIDNKYLIIGSANYSYSAFFKNYEYILITQDKNLINKFNKYFYMLKQNAKPYRLSR
ncbi:MULTISPECIES: phospholipase D-like domain-containing protein [unclassified Lebetimonas]|uniref:phospholipase D-like domain-containing protein n=1 Tax=unclassified Lebetimonas TaxID=2648158 RepID=UPI001EF0F22B|nr:MULTISPECIES: phospholipase D-like domain-containing protein [unclassified Lebetimonas]